MCTSKISPVRLGLLCKFQFQVPDALTHPNLQPVLRGPSSQAHKRTLTATSKTYNKLQLAVFGVAQPKRQRVMR